MRDPAYREYELVSEDHMAENLMVVSRWIFGRIVLPIAIAVVINKIIWDAMDRRIGSR